MTWDQRGRFLVSWQWPRLVGLSTFTVLLFQLCIVYYSLQLHKCLLPSVFYLVKKKTKKEALLFTLFEAMMVSLSKRLLTLLDTCFYWSFPPLRLAHKPKSQMWSFKILVFCECKLQYINNRFLRKRGMASNPKMEYQVFLCIFQKKSAKLNWDSLQGRLFSLPSQRNCPISFKPKGAIVDFFWKMQRKTWYSILGLDAMPFSLKNLLLKVRKS